MGMKPAKSGYFQVDADHELDVKNSGVEFARWLGAMWVPRWVHDAIGMYCSKGGFADMSLSEYLRKMANANL